MTIRSSIACLAIALLAAPAANVSADTVSNAGTTTTAVHLASGNGVVLDSGDYYGSGSDDAFSEYGITTFNFGGSFSGPVSSLNSVSLNLTVNDRTFSDGDMVEFFFTPDTAADLDNGGGNFSALSYDVNFTNGIDPSQFVTAPVSLGVFSIAEMAGRAGGETDDFSFTFSGAAESELIAAINNGTDFQILIGTTNSEHDITYSGVGNTFDPGDPTLEINANVIPEPVSGLLIGLIGVAGMVRRRK